MSDTSPWTDEAIAHLDVLLQHQPPLNYDAIADRMVSQFHRIFTKNSCISRARRSKQNKERAKNKPRAYRHPVEAVAPPKAKPRRQGRVELVQLDHTTCRWPMEDRERPPFLFCGDPPIEGQPYCLSHCRRAYPALGRH